LVDTNCDPDDADFVIPGNDDAIRSCNLIASVIADGIAAGSRRVEVEEFAVGAVNGQGGEEAAGAVEEAVAIAGHEGSAPAETRAAAEAEQGSETPAAEEGAK
jgi:small subunit ribosomal protein S2